MLRAIPSQSAYSKTTLLDLPVELHRLIFDYLPTAPFKWAFLHVHPTFRHNPHTYLGHLALPVKDQIKCFKRRAQLRFQGVLWFPNYIKEEICTLQKLPDTFLPNKKLFNAAAAVGNQRLCQWFLEEGPFGQRTTSGQLIVNPQVFDKELFWSAFESHNEDLILYLFEVIQEGFSTKDQQHLTQTEWFPFLLRFAIRKAYEKVTAILIIQYGLLPNTRTLMDWRVISAVTLNSKVATLWKQLADTYPTMLSKEDFLSLLEEHPMHSMHTGILAYWIQHIHLFGISLPEHVARIALYKAIKTADIVSIYLLNQNYQLTLTEMCIHAIYWQSKTHTQHNILQANDRKTVITYILDYYAHQLTHKHIEQLIETAAYFGFSEIVTAIIQKYHTLNATCYIPAIRTAAAQGHLTSLQCLYPYINNTVLRETIILAVMKGQTHIVDALRKHAPYMIWDTALLLQFAAQTGQFKTFQYLFELAALDVQHDIPHFFKATIDWNHPIAWPFIWKEPEWSIHNQHIQLAQYLFERYPNQLLNSSTLSMLLEIPPLDIEPKLIYAHITLSLNFANRYATLYPNDGVFQSKFELYIEQLAYRGYIEFLYQLIIEKNYPNLPLHHYHMSYYVEKALRAALKVMPLPYQGVQFKQDLACQHDICDMAYQLLIRYQLEKTMIGTFILAALSIEGELTLVLNLVKRRNQNTASHLEEDKKIVDLHFLQGDLPTSSQHAYQAVFNPLLSQAPSTALKL
jgi:hypothetical protein